MAALNLNEEDDAPLSDLFPAGFSKGFGTPAPEPRTWGDVASDAYRMAESGVYGLGKMGVGLLEMQTPKENLVMPNQQEYLRERHADFREDLTTAQEEARAKMTPTGRRRAEAPVLPGGDKDSLWSEGFGGAVEGLMHKTLGSLPSTAASLMAGLVTGPIGAYIAAGGITAGDFYEQAREDIMDASSAELAAKHPLYAGYIDMGMTEDQARDQLLDDTARTKAMLMGMFTAASSRFGLEGRFHTRLGGGKVGGRLAGAAGEAVQEGSENIVQGLLGHYHKEDVTKEQKPIDWWKLANDVAEGMVVGGVSGGALGGGAHAAEAKPAPKSRGVNVGDVAPDVELATTEAVSPTPPAPVTPEATAQPDLVGQLEDIPNTSPLEVPPGTSVPAQPGATAPATPAPVPERSIATAPAPSGLAPEEEAALVPTVTEEGWEDAGEQIPTEAPAIPPLPVGQPVVTPEVARVIGSAGVGQPSPTSAATTPATEVETPSAASAVAPEPIQETAPITPGVTAPVAPVEAPAAPVTAAQRVLRPTAELAREKKSAAARGPRVSKKMREQAEAGKEVLPAKEAAKRDRTEALNAVAQTAKAKIATIPYDPATLTDKKAMRAYAKQLAEAADPKVSLANLTPDADPVLHHLVRAKNVLRPGTTQDQLVDFMVSDFAYRKGDNSLIEEYRKAQAPSGGPEVTENVGEEGIPVGRSETATPGAVANRAAKATERGAFLEAWRQRAGLIPDRARYTRNYRRLQKGQVKAAAPAAAGEFSAVTPQAKPVVVETRKTRKIVKPGTAAGTPAVIRSAADMKKAAAHVTQPTAAQAEAGNYPMAHLNVQGLKAAVETPAGGIREDTKNDPPRWKVKLKHAYGKLKGTKGADGEEVDVIFGPNPNSQRVWIVDQRDISKRNLTSQGPFDEHKVMVGFDSQQEATQAYHGMFSDGSGPARVQGITEVTVGQLKEMTAEPMTEPVSRDPAKVKGAADIKRVAKERTATTEGAAREQLAESIARDNQDVLNEDLLASPMMVKEARRLWNDATPLFRRELFEAAGIEAPIGARWNELTPEQQRKLGKAALDYWKKANEEYSRLITEGLMKEKPLARATDEITDADWEGVDDSALRSFFRRAQRSERKPEVRTTLGRLLKKHTLPEGLTPQSRMMLAQIRDRIAKLTHDVPVRIVDYNTMLELWADHMEKSGETSLAHGFYDPNTDEIVLREDQVDALLVAHEGAHAVYYQAMKARPDVRQHIEQLMEDVRHQIVREAHAEGITHQVAPYGLTDADEFLAEAFSNPDFQELLARTPASHFSVQSARAYPQQGITVWKSLIRKLGEIMWGKDTDRYPFRMNALEQLIKATEQLDPGAVQSRRGGPMLARPLLGRLGDGPIINVAEEYARGTAEVATDDFNFRRVGLVAATFHTLTKQFDGLFGGTTPLKRIQKAMDDMRQTAQGVAEESRTHAEGWLKLDREDHAEAQRAAQNAIDLTMANFNPVDKANFTEADLLAANPHLKNKRWSSYQARKRMMALNAEFMALKPATRQLITSSGNWFREMQNKMTMANIGKLLRAVNEHLTIQQYADLTKKIAHGRLTDEDADLIGDKKLFKAMQHASELRVIDGIYFPLMRHGNYIVPTRAKIANLHGGKMVAGEEDVIEWVGKDEKEAQALYQKFADDPLNPTVTSTGLVRYDPQGKIIKAVDAKGNPHTVAFRARVNRRGTHFFETQRAANRFIRDAQASGDYEFVQPTFLHRQDAMRSGELSTQQMKAILDTIEGRKDIKDDQREILANVLREASIRQLSGNRIEHRSLVRRNIKGASTDIPRNIVQYGQAAGNSYARTKHLDDVREPFQEMVDYSKARHADKERQAREQVIEEVRKRVLAGGEEEMRTPRWVRDMYTLSYLYRLFSPAYSMLNATQPGIITAPVLAGEYGVVYTMAALTRAYNTVGGRGVLGAGLANTGRAGVGLVKRAITINTSDVIGSIRKNLAEAPDGKALLEVFDEAVARGKIEDNAGQEVAAAVGVGGGAVRRGLARFDRVARQLPQAVEALNRAVTLVAAYRLHKAATGNHAQAMEVAFDKMMTTQGDYSVQNNPRFFNHPLAKPAVQFKKYALMMGNLLYDNLQRALGKNPSRADRLAAIRTLGYITATQVMVAGALGLPGLELIKAAAMVAGLLGLGDGWDDWERRIRKAADDNLGKDFGEMLTTGVIGKLIDVDLSKRLSLSDLAIYGEPKDYDKDGVQSYLFQTIAGAPGSMVFDWAKGLNHAAEGDFLKAAETMLPVKTFSDIAKAVGGYNRRDMTAGDAVRQALGFRSRTLAEEGFQKGAQIATNQKRAEEAKDLSRRYINAETKAELMKVRAQIVAHNKAVDDAAKKQFGPSASGSLKQKVFPTALDKVRASNEARRKARTGREANAVD